MRKTTALVLVLTFVISLFAFLPGASAAEVYYVKTQNGGRLNLREEPNTHCKVLLKIPYGDEVLVFEFVGNGWVYGHWGGEFGYVQSRYLTTTPPGPYVPKATKKPASSQTSTQAQQAAAQQQAARAAG